MKNETVFLLGLLALMIPMHYYKTRIKKQILIISVVALEPKTAIEKLLKKTFKMSTPGLFTAIAVVLTVITIYADSAVVPSQKDGPLDQSQPLTNIIGLESQMNNEQKDDAAEEVGIDTGSDVLLGLKRDKSKWY